MKKLFFLAALLVTPFLFQVGVAQAQDASGTEEQKTVDVHIFHGEGCPHCEDELAFLEEVKEQYDFVEVHEYEVWGDAANRELMQAVAEELNVEVGGVPFTVIGDQHMVGYSSDQTSGQIIMGDIANCLTYDCENIVLEQARLIDGDALIETVLAEEDPILEAGDGNVVQSEGAGSVDMELDLPLIGLINAGDFSLPALTILIGGLDGFNPCAMWTLIFLISLLVTMENKRRMWVLGSAFIFASAFVYFLFMSAWLNFFLFIGFIVWIRLIIGGVALASGAYNLREYFTNKEGVCKVTADDGRKKVFTKLKEVTQSKNFWLALGGIIVLAFAVNLVELVCSAGLPAIYTQILTMSDLATWQYYAYLSLYIFIFMLDDLLIFIISMVTLQITGMTTKYTRWSHLIGGILMLILGAILILQPELLMFG